MGIPVQQGTPVRLGFGSLSYPGYIPVDGVVFSRPARIIHSISKYDTGDTRTKIIVDKGTRLELRLIILDSGGSITPPDDGDIITLTSPDGGVSIFFVESAPVSLARGAAMLRMELIAEDSVVYA
jgi:hypothetical protein